MKNNSNNLINDFKNEVLLKNKEFNLTSIKEDYEFEKKHIKDSLLILEHINLDNKSILDLGTGAGFPGVILAITNPNAKFTLIDSNAKKIKFINSFIQSKGILNINAIVGRGEDLKQKFDIVLTRAVARTGIILEITKNLLNQNGHCILYKGKNYQEELNFSKKEINSKLGFTLSKIWESNLDLETKRYFVDFIKDGKGSESFPRQYSQIKNKPLF